MSTGEVVLLVVGLSGLLAIPMALLWKLRRAAKVLAEGKEIPGGRP